MQNVFDSSFDRNHYMKPTQTMSQIYHSVASSWMFPQNGWHFMTPCLTQYQLRHLAAPCCTRSSISSTSFEANCVERKCSRPSWQEMRAQFLRMLICMEQSLWDDISFSDFQMSKSFSTCYTSSKGVKWTLEHLESFSAKMQFWGHVSRITVVRTSTLSIDKPMFSFLLFLAIRFWWV